jgi:hypothetical protein
LVTNIISRILVRIGVRDNGLKSAGWCGLLIFGIFVDVDKKQAVEKRNVKLSVCSTEVKIDRKIKNERLGEEIKK